MWVLSESVLIGCCIESMVAMSPGLSILNLVGMLQMFSTVTSKYTGIPTYTYLPINQRHTKSRRGRGWFEWRVMGYVKWLCKQGMEGVLSGCVARVYSEGVLRGYVERVC